MYAVVRVNHAHTHFFTTLGMCMEHIWCGHLPYSALGVYCARKDPVVCLYSDHGTVQAPSNHTVLIVRVCLSCNCGLYEANLRPVQYCL